MPYENMKMYAPSDQRELDLREIDKYDSMNPELFYDYVDRLEHAKSFLDTHITNDRSGDMKRSMLDYSGLAGGMTNFWQNPYDFIGMDQSQASQLKMHPDYMDRKEWAYVGHNNPYDININTQNVHRDQMPSSRLLGHEMGHTKVGVEDLNRKKGYAASSWEPNFTPGFKQDLVNLRTQRGPYYQAAGLGDNMDETMGWLRGREGELRVGKTLRDDPATSAVFAKHPGMYEEYVRSSKAIRGLRGKR